MAAEVGIVFAGLLGYPGLLPDSGRVRDVSR